MIFFRTRTLRRERDTAVAIGTACMARYVAETDALRTELHEARAAAKFWRDSCRLAESENAGLRVTISSQNHEIGHHIARIDALTAKLARYTAPRKRGVDGKYLPLDGVQ